ncbi:MAG: M20 family metallopeptidase [Phycisphaerales bacterium JB039]
MSAQTATSTSLAQRIADDISYLTDLRHDLHAAPELSYQERTTSARIVRELEAAGIAYKSGLARGTGVIAHLPATDPAGASRKAIALRADTDALPITEATGKPYASKNEGVMHACGHDGHTTILLGAARALAKVQRPRPVTLLFQPAEEGGAGGAAMCEDGALDGEAGGSLGPPVESIFGLHGWPRMTLGHVGTRPGPLLAATDDFTVTIRGAGGHAAQPNLARDPIVAAAHVIAALQTIASRAVAPTDAVVCTVARMSAGTANNIIPETAELEGTVRTLTAPTRALARQRFYEIVELAARAHGCEAAIDWQDGYPVTRNDAALTQRFFEIARSALGDTRVELVAEPTMGGEDFSYYGERIPACFFFLGVVPDGQDPLTHPQLHQPDYDFNDDALATGVELMCRLALEA